MFASPSQSQSSFHVSTRVLSCQRVFRGAPPLPAGCPPARCEATPARASPVTAPPVAVVNTANQQGVFAASAPPPIDWDNLGFGLHDTDAMYCMRWTSGSSNSNGTEWQQGEVVPFRHLSLSPAAGVLNYGQGVFEGMKAYNTEDGKVLLFRPHENARRIQESAERMSMPAPDEQAFVHAVVETVKANRRWIPPPGKGSLYIRPLLIGTGAVLGLAAAPEFTFLVYVSPVGNYFKGGTLTPIDLVVEEHYHRAAPGGTGAAKTIGNYSPVLKTQLLAKKNGFADVLFLDAVENKYIEEVSSCNIFTVKGNVLSTPSLNGTILAGITRRSILELGHKMGYQVSECQISVEELLSADEVFCTGTAVVVSPVASVTYRGNRCVFSECKTGPVAQRLYTELTQLQMGNLKDEMGWTMEVPCN